MDFEEYFSSRSLCGMQIVVYFVCLAELTSEKDNHLFCNGFMCVCWVLFLSFVGGEIVVYVIEGVGAINTSVVDGK